MKKYNVTVKMIQNDIIKLTAPYIHIKILANLISDILSSTCEVKKINDYKGTIMVKVGLQDRISFYNFITIICFLKNLRFKKPPKYYTETETEVKILETNRKKIVQKIISMGGKKVFESNILTTWFDFPNSFLKNNSLVIRIKKIGNSYILGYKGPLQNSNSNIAKVREEVEVKIDNYKELIKFFKSINLRPIGSKKKHRISYSLDGSLIEFDKISKPINIPEFLEIEAGDYQKILECAKKIGYSEKDFKSWGSGKLIEHYSKKQFE